MDFINGLGNAFTFSNLWYCFAGCLLGTAVGVLPGLGPATTMSILLPISLYLPATEAIIMMSGIYYGAMYGGSTASILMNIPGETASVVTCLDGFQMTRKGRAGEALAIAAIGSFIAGILGAIMIATVGSGLAKYALRFSYPEYFSLLMFSLTMLISLAGKSLWKGVACGLAGILLATVGLDPMTGSARLDFGIIGLRRGISLIPLAVGLFGIGEILINVKQRSVSIYEGKLGRLIPQGTELKRGILGSVQGSITGFILGLLPGMLPALSAFLSYDVEKKLSRHPEKFGTGVIEGVAAPEAANNATAMAGFIPMIAFGIPTTPQMAIIMAALIMRGLHVGPTLFQENTLFIWTVIASMFIGNVVLLVLNLPLVGLWARLCLVPFKLLVPIILSICLVGVYAVGNSMFDVWTAILFGVIGFVMKERDWPLAPLILGFILGDMIESALRQSLTMSGGSPLIFFTRPISLVLILMTIVGMVSLIYLRRRTPASILTEEK